MTSRPRSSAIIPGTSRTRPDSPDKKMAVRVATASETVASERTTIERGTSSASLMRRAGESAAILLAERYQSTIAEGAIVFAGSGNNGGDGWVVAESLARSGIDVSVFEIAPPRTDEAIAARAAAVAQGRVIAGGSVERRPLVVDAILGTGSSGVPREGAADAIQKIEQMRAHGSDVISLDLPSGRDATTGEHRGSV